MTCIIGMVDKKAITLGGDAAGSNGTLIQTRLDEKIFIKKKMIFGFTSSFRMGQLLRYNLVIPVHPKKMDDYEYLCTLFINAVTKCLEDNNYAEKKDNVLSGGVFLLGYKGILYTIHGDFQVAQTSYPYASCGSGERYALGALHAIEDSIPIQPLDTEAKILAGLEAAQEFSPSVRGPFKFLVLKNKC